MTLWRWRILGLMLLPFRLWQWACWDLVAGHRMDGSLYPLRVRLGIAWAMWQARYWTDWSDT